MKKLSFNLTVVLVSILSVFALFTSCKKNNNNNSIGGFNSSNDIQSSALKAHWTFDDTPNETISSIAPISNIGSSYVTGIKGKAIHLTDGYLLYPNFAAINGPHLKSITVSCWVFTDNNGSKNSNVFSETVGQAHQPDADAGFINLAIETSNPVSTDDTLVLRSSFSTYPNTQLSRISGFNTNENGQREVDFKTVHGTNKWVHYVTRYDATTSNFDIFANGIMVSNTNLRHKTDVNFPNGLGEILTCGCPSQVIIGAFPNVSTGFPNSPVIANQGLFNGSIDEIRFYTTPLTDSEINSLYQLELAGR